MNICVCDRCSTQLEYDEEPGDRDAIHDGPEGSEWEGCTLCDNCNDLVEVGDSE